MEEIAAETAVKVYVDFEMEHEGHEGEVARYDMIGGSLLLLDCDECEVHRTFRVYVDEAKSEVAS